MKKKWGQKNLGYKNGERNYGNRKIHNITHKILPQT